MNMDNNYKSVILERLNSLNLSGKLRLSSSYYINEGLKPFKALNENTNFTGDVNPNNPNEVKWDNLESNIKKSTQGIDTLDTAKSYFKLLHSKVKSLPNSVKKRAFNTAIIGLGSLMLVNIMNTKSELNTLPTDVKSSILNIDNPVIKTLKDVEVTPEVKTNVRSVSDNLYTFLKNEEGSAKVKGQPVLTAYDLGDGAITIGWGHAESKNNTDMVPRKTKITLSKANELLKNDVEWASDRLNTILDDWESKGINVNITQGMYDAMVSMIFNMGIGNFRKSKFIQLVKQNKLKLAKDLIKKTHITYPGHKPRRNKESNMFK